MSHETPKKAHEPCMRKYVTCDADDGEPESWCEACRYRFATKAASPPAADTGREIAELLRRRGAAILAAVKAKDRDLGYQVGMLLDDIARVSGQPVGEGRK